MDKLSKILKEAKPLYRQRQRRKMIGKMILTISMPAIILGNICQIYMQGSDIYLSLKNDSLQQELLEDEFAILETSNWKI